MEINIDELIAGTNIKIKQIMENLTVDQARNIDDGIKGVYIFRVYSGDYYVGKSESLNGVKSRICSHTKEAWQKKIIVDFNIYIPENISHISRLENLMILKLQPRLNTVGVYKLLESSEIIGKNKEITDYIDKNKDIIDDYRSLKFKKLKPRFIPDGNDIKQEEEKLKEETEELEKYRREVGFYKLYEEEEKLKEETEELEKYRREVGFYKLYEEEKEKEEEHKITIQNYGEQQLVTNTVNTDSKSVTERIIDLSLIQNLKDRLKKMK